MNFTLDLEQLVESGVSFERVLQEIVAPQLETEYKRICSVNARNKKFQKAKEAVLSDSYTCADLEVLQAHLDERRAAARMAPPEEVETEEEQKFVPRIIGKKEWDEILNELLK